MISQSETYGHLSKVLLGLWICVLEKKTFLTVVEVALGLESMALKFLKFQLIIDLGSYRGF